MPSPSVPGPGMFASSGRAPIAFSHRAWDLTPARVLRGCGWSAGIRCRPVEAPGDERIHGVRQPRGEVVLDLEVEAAHQPVQCPAPILVRQCTSTVVRSWWAMKSGPRRGVSDAGNAAGSAQWASWNIVASNRPTVHEIAR